MASIGLNVSADGAHSPELVSGLGATWIRIVATPDHDLSDYFQRCRSADLKILLILAHESGGDYARYRDQYGTLVDAIQVGNEMDHESPSSWTMTQAEFVSLGRATRAIFPRPFPLVAGGLVSGQPSWLDGVDLSWADRLAVHPYGKAPSREWPHPGWGTGYMGDLLDAYLPYAMGKPVIISELGLSTTEVTEAFQAEYVRRCADFLNQREDVDVWFWFAIGDDMVPSFGLLGPRGREKPAAKAFREQAALAIDSSWPGAQEPPMPAPKTRAEVIAISSTVAWELGIPRLLLLACGIAESDLRWNARRPTDPSQDAAFWTDVSHGVWQQTVRWSQEYKDWYTNDAPGHPPGQFPGADVTEAAGVHYYDVEHAARVAARQLKAHYRPSEADAIWRALNRYNFPAGDGEPKSPGIGQNYRRGITEAEAILGTAPPPSGIIYEAFPDPSPAGTFSGAPRGIVLHGSRSGAAGNSQLDEYRGTASWERTNPHGLGWNVTIADHRVAEHIDVRQWGHHAKHASRHYLSIEFAQPTVNHGITDAQVDAAADWIKTRVTPAWGNLGFHFPTHAEVQVSGETGDRGNTDVYPLGDPRLDTLRNRLYKLLGAPSGEEPPPPPPVDSQLERARTAARELLAILEEG